MADLDKLKKLLDQKTKESDKPLDLSKENPLEVLDSLTGKPTRRAAKAILSGENPLKAAVSDEEVTGKDVAKKFLQRLEESGATLRAPGQEEYPSEAPLGLAAEMGLDIANIPLANIASKTSKIAKNLPKVESALKGAVGQGVKVTEKTKAPTLSELFASLGVVDLNSDQGKMIAKAYDMMKHNPNNPEVRAAYNALIKETEDQYQNMLDSGFKVSKIKPEQKNPYASSKEVYEDIEKNKHLWFYPTSQGFGTEAAAVSTHPLLKPTKYTHEGEPLLANDLFRIVHDYRGHYLGDKSSFGPKGEHRAYLKHKEDFSPLAQQALATETMGQNSWVNFGPFGKANRKNPAATVYADQKAGLLPKDIIEGNWHSPDTTEEDVERFNKIMELLKKK